MEHTPRVPLDLIGRTFGVERGTIYNHWRKYSARRNETKHAGCPPGLSWQKLDEAIADILHGFQQRRPLNLPEIASIVQNKTLKASAARYPLSCSDTGVKIERVPRTANQRTPHD
jgi:hypothetical protein